MLDNTFIHLPGFGPRRERRMWDSGITNWDEFIDRFNFSPFHKMYCMKVASSKYALQTGDAKFFADALPNNETWRSFPHFEKIAYLDIETTGLGLVTDHVTVIGVFDGNKVHSYVHGQNIEDFEHDIEQYDMVVTFNGSMFDIPFLKKSIKGVKMPQLHVDLRFLLASLDVRGGLKKIETNFGFEREDDLKGLTGYDAVLLWQKYRKNNDKDALDILVRYNAADISNLKKLLEWGYREKRLRTGFDEIMSGGTSNKV